MCNWRCQKFRNTWITAVKKGCHVEWSKAQMTENQGPSDTTGCKRHVFIGRFFLIGTKEHPKARIDLALPDID